MSLFSGIGNLFKTVGGDIEHGLEGAAKGFLGGGTPGAIAGFVGGAIGSGAAPSSPGGDFQQALLRMEESQTADGEGGIDDWDD